MGAADSVVSPNERALRFMFSKVEIVTRIGLELLEWDDSSARVRMPFSSFIDNRSGTPLGGAIATLIDITGAAAVWAGHDFSLGGKHATVSMSINFVGAGRGEDLIAMGRCIRRQAELNFVNVEVQTASGRAAATALMTFRVTG
jgi:uncharacterized protein (TIGR00369 family)